MPVWRIGDDKRPLYKVQFKKEGKWIEELHPKLEIEEVKGVVLVVLTEADKELLKPLNMALVSPRMFWALTYHFKGE